ncbi:bacterial low temperature requirement A protein-domain-containing protein [Podospora australis]|uniref:Bacterial low temperature requirement A protein-domain-containing protein n=1 Tax=Podospora australis TaxID=1536484 RepID=A0AAN6WQ23_9PEZI|nr:bacterial low temperature requirement A protein-domain-containing protein [Podospora australis]
MALLLTIQTPLHALTHEQNSREEGTNRRIHTIVPWIQNPLQGVDTEHLVFSPRHEASTLELFFDLFFVANLATFTTYHAIVDHSSLFAYIGFFAIIWATWYHTVLYDVRFENDSIYSRACKVVIMIAFVGFALVGSNFAPGTKKGDNTSFRYLCYTLVLSRVLFAIQYLVVVVFVALSKRTDLYGPLLLNALVYMIAAGAFGAMIIHFGDYNPVDEKNGVYAVWWIVLALEAAAVITISSFWRMLSFKKTHIVERMGLLTLIVIGEAAIGATKTISRMMGKNGLDPEGSGMVLCIVLILIGTWMLYFDNHPHGHFGTIKQQFWSAMHFPIHLAIVGLVESAQQIALARYMTVSGLKLEKEWVRACFKDHYDGAQLLYARTMAAMYTGLGLSIPLDVDVLEVMFESWKLVYRYFWAAFLILIGCFLVAMFLIRKNKLDAFYLTSYLDRMAVIVAGAAILAVSASKDMMYTIMEQPIILPVAVGFMYFIIIADRLGMYWANYRNRKSGDPLSGGEKHGHGQGHDTHGESGYGKDATEVTVALVSPEPRPHPTHRPSSYNPLGGGSVVPTYYDNAYSSATSAYAAEAYQTAPPATHQPSGGYMPVHNGQYTGAGY